MVFSGTPMKITMLLFVGKKESWLCHLSEIPLAFQKILISPFING